MQRAAKLLIQASEIMFGDAKGNSDVENRKMFMVHSSSEGIPIQCVITLSETLRVMDDYLKQRKVLEMFCVAVFKM